MVSIIGIGPRDLPGGPLVGAPWFHYREPGFDPGPGTKILNALWHGTKKKKKKKTI